MSDQATRLKIVIPLVALAAVAGGAVWTSSHPSSSQGPSSEQAQSTKASAGTEKPKDRVALSADQMRMAGIGLLTPHLETQGAEILVQGTVVSAPNGQAVLSAGADGRIVRIDKGLGESVGHGQRVALIESREAATISADQLVSGAKLRLAQATFERERKLFLEKVTARADYESAIAEYQTARAEAGRASAAKAAANASGRFISVRSPISGSVTAAPAVLGTYVTAQTELFRIATSVGVRVEAALPVSDSYRIKPGDSARLLFPGGEISGRVRAITPSATVESRAATVVVDPQGGASLLRAGQFVQVALRTGGSGPASLMLPEEAVQSVGGHDIVFVRDGGTFLVRPVTIGTRSGGRVNIVSGLRDGETVAGKNAFLVKAELQKSSSDEE